MKRALAVGVAFVSIALLVSGCGSSRQTTSLPGLTATRLVKLKTIVRVEARTLGDAHPSSVMVYATQAREANIATGSGARNPVRQRVYLVVARGYFSCYGCDPSAGSGPASGEIMTLLLDRETLLGVCCGGLPSHVDTSRVGPGLRLVLG